MGLEKDRTQVRRGASKDTLGQNLPLVSSPRTVDAQASGLPDAQDGKKGKKDKKVSGKLKMSVYQAAMDDSTDEGEQEKESNADEESSTEDLESY